MNNYIIVVFFLGAALVGMIFLIPPFHSVIIGLFLLMCSILCGVLATYMSAQFPRSAGKKRAVGIVMGVFVFLVLLLQVLQILSPLNMVLVSLLCVSLLAL